MGTLSKVSKWFGFLVKASLAAGAIDQVLIKIRGFETNIKALGKVVSAAPSAEEKDQAVQQAVLMLLVEYRQICDEIRSIRDTFK